MRLINADKLIYQSHAQHLEPYINKKDIDNAPTVEMAEDCVKREDVKKFLYERLDRLNDDELYDIFSKIIDDMYNELPSVTPQTRWIPVSERLPKEDGMYLISTCMNCIDTCLFYKDDDEYLWVDYEESVIAWMPLPQSYKAESEVKE